ncbi:MAG: YggL family protein [Gemmataceae bacterium]|nr:YggL family protein [Gemmataceae bacterium]
MRRRLRKKRRIGEFRQDVFRVTIRTVAMSREEEDAFLDYWLEACVEEHGLGFGGGCREGRWDGYIQRSGRTTTDDDRRTIEEWLKNEPRVAAYAIGTPVDGWYGDFDDSEPVLLEKSVMR